MFEVFGGDQVVESAMALQEAGCFSVALECVPPPVAAAVTSGLGIPTIGIGAGPAVARFALSSSISVLPFSVALLLFLLLSD